MKIAKKVVIILMLTCIIINLMQGFSEAAVTFPTWSELVEKGKGFVDQGRSNGGDDIFSDDDVSGLVVPVANILTAVGTIIIVVLFIILGIKFMTASPEQAAKSKQQLIGLVVAAVILFGAVTIWNLMFEIMDNISSNL